MSEQSIALAIAIYGTDRFKFVFTVRTQVRLGGCGIHIVYI